MSKRCLPIALFISGLVIILGGVGFYLARRNAKETGVAAAAAALDDAEGKEVFTGTPTVVPTLPAVEDTAEGIYYGDPGSDNATSYGPTYVRTDSPTAVPTSSPTSFPSDITSNPTNNPSDLTDMTSPSPSNPSDLSQNPTFEVTIIGAGAAGLSAAYTLHHSGSIPPSAIRILEASHTLGGRARSDSSSFSKDSPLDLGASFIQYPSAIRRIVGRDDVMATPDGTGLPVFVNYTWWDFLNDHIAPKSPEVIVYGCRVVKVEYATSPIETKCEDDRRFISKYVIVTVPLPILKDGDIAFAPALPTKLTVKHPGWMWQGFKVFAEFTKGFYDSFCFRKLDNYEDSCLDLNGENLFWEYSSVHATSNGNTIMAGFILGEPSLPFIDMDDEEIMQEVLQMMDDKFNGKASKFYVRGMVTNWSKDPNIRGTLSSFGYDKPGAQSVEDKVLVAGEAFPIDGNNGWVDAGAFSGDDAAKQILKLLGIKVDNLWFWRKVRENQSRN